MQLRRLTDSASLFLLLLLPLVLVTNVTANGDEPRLDLDSDDLNPHELNVNVDEPKIDIPEVHRKQNPFRNVSQGVRAPSRDPLVSLCQEAVDTTTRRLLSTEQHTPWQMIHALLGLRHDFMLQHGDQVVSGLEWIAQGQTFDNEYWFEKTQFGGRAHPYTRPYAFEGHANQTVAILSMCGVDLDMEFGTADGTITMRQMIEHAKMSIDVVKDEPTWTLWALSRYLPPDARWRNAKGEMWSIERLVKEQTDRPIKGAACGGTHGLFALAHARNVYLRQGKPLRGVWQEAEMKIRRYIQTARMQQNSNGTLSSNYFRGREYNPDFNKRMGSAGHLLEFLMIALPQEELRALWVRRAIEATARDLLNNRKAYVKCSPLYHSVNALNIYLDRVNPRSAPQSVASEEPPQTAMVTPRRLPDSRGELKGVPAMGISRSQDTTDPMPTQPEPSSETSTGKSDPADTTIAIARSPILLPTPDTSDPASPISVVEPKPIVKENGTWVATPPSRRKPIILPGERSLNPDNNAVTQPETSATVTSEDTTPAQTVPAQTVPENGQAPVSEPTPLPADETEIESETPEPMPEADSDTDAVPTLLVPTPEADPDAELPVEPGSTSTTDVEESAVADSATAPSVATDDPAGRIANPSDSNAVPSADTAPVDPNFVPNRTTRVFTPMKSISSTRDRTDTDAENKSSSPPPFDPATSEAESLADGVSELAQAQSAITAAVDLKAGQRVAVLGGTAGLFLNSFSTAVTSTGRVFAIDPDPSVVNLLEQQVSQQELTNVDVVRSDQKSLLLGKQRIDAAFLCNAYQHFVNRPQMLASIFRTLETGGDLVVVDRQSASDNDTQNSAPPNTDKSAIRTDIEAAGFHYVEEVAISGLKTYYFLKFRRPTR
ncbi:MAG: methyltransferase domain-containing protein [Planctomycetaceae bacterium]